jgi:hypothetical protein
MDEEKDNDELPPFRWNWQALFMAFFTMAALAIPLAGVLWLARGYLEGQVAAAHATPSPAPQAINTHPLEGALERAAESTLGEETKLLGSENEWEIRVAPDEVQARARRVADLARESGGSALEVEAVPPALARLTIQVPSSRRELLRRAVNGEKIDFAAIPASADTDLVEVRFVKRP